MAGYFSIALGKIPKPDELRYEVREKRMVEPIKDPGPKRMHLEEDTFLSELVQLRVTIEQASRNELVENPYHNGWEDGKEYVVKGQGPRFENDFARKCILERILYANGQLDGRFNPRGCRYPKLCHIQRDILVEGVENQFRNPLIAPSPVYQQELSKISELADSYVGAPSCLKTFDATYTYSNMCCLDHGDIVGAVSDR